MLETHILKINRNLSTQEFNILLNYVQRDKKKRILRFYRYEDSQRCLLGDILAKYAVCKREGISSENLIVKTNEYGKPFLIEPRGIYFNISHSKSLVVCAVDNNPVGIDVEEIKSIDFSIAERFFTKEEYTELTSQPEKNKLKYFYMIWTLKESYIKAEGKGLSIPLNSFSMNIAQTIRVSADNKSNQYNFFQLPIDNNGICSLCTFSDSNIVVNWNIDTFLQKIHHGL